MKRRPAVFAWAALVIGVVAYDAACPPGHTMSEEVDRWLDTSPVVVWVVLGLVAAHLLNLLPKKLDPLHILFTKLGRKRH